MQPLNGKSNHYLTNNTCLVRHLQMYVHGIPFVITFIVLQNSVVNSNYSMLLGRPWLKDAKVAHDWATIWSLFKVMKYLKP
jgi:hypothetical protein